MMRWLLLATLILGGELYASVFSTENCDGDGFYAGAIGGLNTRVRNYGGSSILRCENDGTNDKTIPVLGWSSITSQGSGTVEACTLIIYSLGIEAAGNVNVYLQMKPYIEGTADDAAQNGSSSWDEWYTQSDAAQDTLFTTKGAIAPTAWGDTGSTWNRNDATGDDRTGTTMATVNIVGAATEYKFPLDAAWLNAFMTGTIPQFTLLIIPEIATQVTFYERNDGDYGGVRSARLNIWWGDVVAVTKGTGRFGRSQDGRYLNVR